VEILVPDFRGRMDIALRLMAECPPDVFNHNIETVPRIYKAIRPGSDYQHSLTLLKRFKEECPDVASKCGLMVGIGETKEEVFAVLDDLRAHNVELVTIGQYLQPSKQHAPVDRFVTPAEFEEYADYGRKLGFRNIWSGPMVRSSYHANRQYDGEDTRTPA
jgi:lipoic acid synthetase